MSADLDVEPMGGREWHALKEAHRDATASTEDTVTGEAILGAHCTYGVHISKVRRYFQLSWRWGGDLGSGGVLRGQLGAPGSRRKFQIFVIRLEQDSDPSPRERRDSKPAERNQI